MATRGSGEMESDGIQLLSSAPLSPAPSQMTGADSHSAVAPATEREDEKLSGGGCGMRRGRVMCVLRHQWKMLVILGTPILLSPLPLSLDSTAAMAAYAIALISVYWVTEAVPIAVTALLPLWLFPALGVLSARETAQNYLSDTNMLFVGGLIVAVAIEKWNLHKRIALLVLMAFGSSPRWLLLGFMVTTAFLSMWISNTATAAMMLAIAKAVLQELEEEEEEEEEKEEGEEGSVTDDSMRIVYAKRYTSDSGELSEEVTVEIDRDGNTGEVGEERSLLARSRGNEGRDEKNSGESFRRLSKVLVLGVAYSANIGGTATLTGTGPNIVLSGLSVSLFPDSGGINFGLWFLFATPAMVLTLGLSWLYLSLLFCDDSFVWLKRRLLKRRMTVQSQRAKRVIREQYRQLGKIKYAEVVVLVLFVVLALLWLLREPRFIPGWASLFRSDGQTSYFSDSSTVMFIVFLMFIIPSRPPWGPNSCWNEFDAILDWNTIQTKLAWNVVILLGSALALSAGAKESGLSAWIGRQLLSLRGFPAPAIALCISVIIAGVTEVMSNVATSTLFLPVLAELAVEMGINPLYFMIPATVSASFAFMLPVATPPNAMAFSYGYLKVYNMVLTGLFMNLLCVGVVTLALNTTGRLIFHLNSFPSWAGNISSSPFCVQWSPLNFSSQGFPQ